MNDIRILVYFDNKNSFYNQYLLDKRFKVDTRSIIEIGNDNSADALSEYEAIIINIESATTLPFERFKQLHNFIHHKDKLLCIFLNRHYETPLGSSTLLIGGMLDRLGISPMGFINLIPSGKNYFITEEGKRSLFYNYLNTDTKSWKISFYDKSLANISVLAYNSEKEIIAFSVKTESANYFIPWVDNKTEIFWKSVSDYLLNKYIDSSFVSEWVHDYELPNMKELNSIISKKEEEINNLIKEKEMLIEEKSRYEKIRNVLMYYDGDILHEICREVLLVLGLNVSNGVAGREDLVILHNNVHFLIEIKGSTKSASKKNISQLNSHAVQYKNDNEVEPKGILLINAWRELPLDERGTNDKPIFPPEIMKLVKISNIALITTQQLFVAYCEFLQNKFELDLFTKSINECIGEYNLYKDISSFKKSK